MRLLDTMLKGEKAPYDIFDMHGHLGHFNYGMPDVTPGFIVKCMDKMGVRSIIVSHLQCICRDVHWGNDAVFQAIKEYPNRILGYISLFPGSLKEVEEECALRKEQKFTGFKFHNNNGFCYDDPYYAPSWSMANQYHMPILYHTWGDPKVFQEIANVAKQAPNAPILLGHSTSCNMPAYIAMAKEIPNVYLELCGSNVAYGSVEKLVAAVGAEKVIWGSDCLFYSMTQQVGRIAGSHLSEEEKKTILSDNAKRILADIR